MDFGKRVEGQITLLSWLQVIGPGWVTDVYVEAEPTSVDIKVRSWYTAE